MSAPRQRSELPVDNDSGLDRGPNRQTFLLRHDHSPSVFVFSSLADDCTHQPSALHLMKRIISRENVTVEQKTSTMRRATRIDSPDAPRRRTQHRSSNTDSSAGSPKLARSADR